MPARSSRAGTAPRRCDWPTGDPLYLRYHDEEWGVPVHDDRHLFEFLVLGGAQAGLSWLTILRKRDNYRRAFDRFDPRAVARYTGADVDRLLADTGIVRNRLKIAAAVRTAAAVVAIQAECGSLDRFVWSFVGGRPRHNRWRRLADIPAQTAESAALSRALAARGCRFAGPTICYAFMQATGMVNDHIVTCFRHAELRG